MPDDTSFTIKLSHEEAQLIADILWLAGGDPRTSRRGLCEEIRGALLDVGIIAQCDANNGWIAPDFTPTSTFGFKSVP